MPRRGLVIPDDLRKAEQPFLFREWFCRNRVRRWMEYERRNDTVVRLIQPKPGMRVLDVGCDWGYACMQIALAGAEAHGVDIDRDSVVFGERLAAANGIRLNLKYANAKSLPYPEAHFHAITMIETIEHVPESDRLQVFAEMARVLAPGGRIVLSTPNPSGIAELAKRILGRLPFLRRRFYGSYHDEGRVRTFPGGDAMVDLLLTTRQIRSDATRAGLETVGAGRIVFVTKFLPERLLPVGKILEAILERIPLINKLASTSVYVMSRPRHTVEFVRVR